MSEQDPPTGGDDEDYDAGSLQSLEGLDGVRERPAMYIGSTDTNGLHHLVQEVVDNSIDEALAGYCDQITVTIHTDGSVSVEDNGRGIPVDQTGEGIPGVQSVVTDIHAGGKFDNDAYKVSGGLHGVGISAVNALSTAFDVTVRRDGTVWHQLYDRGRPNPDGEMEELRELNDNEGTGTTIRFWPDADIFETTEFSYDRLLSRLRELAFLNPGVNITTRDLRPEDTLEQSFQYDGGIREYVEYLNDGRDALHSEVVFFDGAEEISEGPVEVEVAMQVTKDVQSSIHAFTNNIHTKDGGTHITGFKTSLTRTLNSYANNHGLLGDLDENLKGEDVREGLTAVISVKHPDPQFEGQTKTKLGNREVRGIVETTMNEELTTYLEERPDIAERIVKRAVQAAKARKKAKKAQEVARRDTPLSSTSLPGKLADCQEKDPTKAELFIVEGDSAGGCFTGETEVALASGRSITFEELVEEQQDGESHYCYTTDDYGQIQLQEITNPRKTREDANLVRITLSNGETIECTPDHEFMLRETGYKEAQNLESGDYLMPINREQASATLEVSLDLMSTRQGHVEKNAESISVQSVESLDRTADVYDIEVPETHNFALESGVFVHNSAKQARDRENQAVLPIKGKILNVEKHRLDRILENDQIRNIVTATGAGIGDEFDIDDVRYQNIILFSVAGDEHAFVRSPQGEVQMVEIGDFIDEAVETDGEAHEDYEVMCFGKDDHETKFKPISQVVRHKISEPLHKVTTQYGRNVKATASHSLFVYEDGEVTTKPTDEITEDDYVVAPRRNPLDGAKFGNAPEKFDLLEELAELDDLEHTIYARGEGIRHMYKTRVLDDHADNPEFSEKRVSPTGNQRAALSDARNEQGLAQHEVCDAIGIAQPITLSQWERGNRRPTISNFRAWCEELGFNAAEMIEKADVEGSLIEQRWKNQYSTTTQKNRVREYIDVRELDEDDLERIPDEADLTITPEKYADNGIDRYVDVDEALLDLMGFWTAEGSCSDRNGVRLAMGASNQHIIGHYQDRFEDVFGLRAKYSDSGTRAGEVKLVNRVAAVVWQRVFGLDASHASEKEMSDLVFNVGEELQNAWLRGYTRGDGTLNSGGCVTWYTTSRSLSSALTYLLSSRGIVPSTTKNEVSGNTFDASDYPSLGNTEKITARYDRYDITVAANEDIRTLENVWTELRGHGDILENLGNEIERNFVEISDDLMAVPVRSNKEVEPEEDEYVYDFAVEKDHTFVAGYGGITCSNTDADVDGAHIRTLILTLLYRHMPELLENGYVYSAKPPLYRIRYKGDTYDAMTEAERERIVEEKCNGSPDQVQRFKGLGEMNPQQLWDATMDPENRTLKRITIDEAAKADRMFSVLMGDDVGPRKEFIQENAEDADWVDI